MARYFANSKDEIYRSGLGGTYPCNDGNPQNDDPEAPTAEELEQQEAESLEDDE